MKRLFSLLLCLALLLVTWSVPAKADDTELFFVECICARCPEGASIQMLTRDNRIYIGVSDAGILLGLHADHPYPGKVTFFSDNLKLTYEGGYVSAVGETWYPLEELMNTLNTRVVASEMKLYFNNTNPAFEALDAAMADYEQIRVTFDPENDMNRIGLGLSKFYDIVSSFSLTDLFGHRYEKEMYRTAMYALLRRSEDEDESNISDLYYYAEDEILSPLSEFYNGMDDMFGEAVMEAFYAGSELEEIKKVIDLYQAGKKTFGATPGDWVAKLEELSFFNGAYAAGVKGVEYLLECSAKNETDEVLMQVMRQVIGAYRGNTQDELWTILFEPMFEYGRAFADESYKTYMLGAGGSAVLKGVDAAMRSMPGMSAMDHLEMSAVYYWIQDLAARQIREAYRSDDLLRLKYSAIIYFRCAYLFGIEMEQMGDSMLETLARDFQEKASEREARLVAISDSMLLQSGCVNEPIYINALRGDIQVYRNFYDNLCQTYGVLNIRDYFGTEYIEEGSGIIAPWMHRVGENIVLTVLRQEGSDLIQMVFLDQGSVGSLALIDERLVLTCGSNGSVYYGFEDESGPLLSCVSFDNKLTAFSCAGNSLASTFHSSDSSADSMSAMRQSAWNHLYRQYGEYEPSFYVDGSDGLFTISQSPAELRTRFLEEFNRPD